MKKNMGWINGDRYLRKVIIFSVCDYKFRIGGSFILEKENILKIC